MLRVTLYNKIMVTLTYSNVDGVERISDGLQTYERAPINLKPFSSVMRVSTTDFDFLAKYKTVTCNTKRGHITERIGDIWEIEERFTHKNFYAFHKELFVRRHYAIISSGLDGVCPLYYVARYSARANVWQPVSFTFKTFEETAAWCKERCIHFTTN